MKNFKNIFIIFVLAIGCFYFYFQNKQPKQVDEILTEKYVKIEKLKTGRAVQIKVPSNALDNTNSLNSVLTVEPVAKQKTDTLMSNFRDLYQAIS